MILRQLDEEGVKARTKEVLLRVPVGIANYLMNHKREHIAGIEQRYGMAVRVEADVKLVSPDFHIERFKTATRAVPDSRAVVMAGSADLMPDEEPQNDAGIDLIDDEAEPVAEAPEEAAAASEDDRPRKKRRRRRRRGRNGERDELLSADSASVDTDDEDEEDEREDVAIEEPIQLEVAPAQSEPVTEPEEAQPADAPVAEAQPDEAPAPRRRTRNRKAAADDVPAMAPVSKEEPTPKRRTRSRKVAEEPSTPEVAPLEAAKPKRARRSRSGAAVANEAEVTLPAPPDPDNEVDAGLALDDEPAIDVPFPPGDAPANAEEARQEAEQIFAPVEEPEPSPSEPTVAASEPQPERPKRRGWWAR
jgi:ribonuclease E